jgi:hypothetical protein
MGYTNYLRQPKAFTDEQWKSFVHDVRTVLEHSPVPLAGWNGEGEPDFEEDFISFNGVGEDAHETCRIDKRAVDFSFCKTNQKPYDRMVVSIYKIAQQHNPSIRLSSDGGPEVFAENSDGMS